MNDHGCRYHAFEDRVVVPWEEREAAWVKLREEGLELGRAHVLDSGKSAYDEYPDFYPDVPARVDEWDAYYGLEVWDTHSPPMYRRPFSGDWTDELPELVARFRQHGVRTILCPGSGPSQEPRYLAWAGFQVTALDISSFAVRAGQHFPLTAQSLGYARIPDHHREAGGTLTFAVGDMRDPNVLPFHYDAIVVRRTLQTLLDGQWAALDALLARRASGGLFVSSFINAYGDRDRYRQHFLDLGEKVWFGSVFEKDKPDDWTARLHFTSG